MHDRVRCFTVRAIDRFEKIFQSFLGFLVKSGIIAHMIQFVLPHFLKNVYGLVFSLVADEPHTFSEVKGGRHLRDKLGPRG